MKILFIEPCFKNFGGYFRAFNIAKALSKQGVKIDLLISSKVNSLKIKKEVINENLTQFELPRINFNFFLNGRITRGVIGCLFVLFKKYDLIHTFSPVQLESNIPTFLAKVLRKKVVMDWDDFWQESPVHKNLNILKFYSKFCEDHIPRFVNNMSATSNFLCQAAEQRGAKKIIKIINGVNYDQFNVMSKIDSRHQLGIDQNEKILLSFGHTYIGPRAYLLLKTYEEIYKLDDSVKLFLNLDPLKLVEGNKLQNGLDLNIVKKIKNVGYLDKERLPLYMAVTDLMMFLMGDENLEKACFPIRIGTYLNGERVIITNDTDTEACNTLKENNCALIGKDPKDIANKVITFFNNEGLRQNMESNVRVAKENLSWDLLVAGLIEFYKTI